MKTTLKTIFLTLFTLIVLDVVVSAALDVSKSKGKLGALTHYFDLGLSVPSKIEVWAQTDNPHGNLFNVAWIDGIIETSVAKHSAEQAGIGPTIRSYGMSFSGNIVEKAVAIDDRYAFDLHGGPAAPANHTYTLFKDDRANRNSGDVVVFGILSSSVTKLAAMSNRTWVFEQPAPFTYPIYYPDGDSLMRIDPLIHSAEQELSLRSEAGLRRVWRDQLARHDQFYSRFLFEGALLDRSSFVRLVRRAISLRVLKQAERRVLQADTYPIHEVLRRMLTDFNATSKEDGLIPIVALIQTRDGSDIDLKAFLETDLHEIGVPFIATADHFDPRDTSGFISDGHYTNDVDLMFGQALLDKIGEIEAD